MAGTASCGTITRLPLAERSAEAPGLSTIVVNDDSIIGGPGDLRARRQRLEPADFGVDCTGAAEEDRASRRQPIGVLQRDRVGHAATERAGHARPQVDDLHDRALVADRIHLLVDPVEVLDELGEVID